MRDKANIIQGLAGNLIASIEIICQLEFLHISPLIATVDVQLGVLTP